LAAVKVLVVGAGGIGGYYGARLLAGGNDVWFLARGANLEALRNKGLDVLGDVGDLHFESVQATDDAAEAGTAEAILFCVKTYDNDSATKASAAAITDGTIICSLQNGVDNEIFLIERFPLATVVAGTTRASAWLDQPGVVIQQGPDVGMVVGAFSEADRSAAAKLGAVLEHAGLPVAVVEDAQAALWLKLVGISSVGSITAYGRCAMKDVLASPELKKLMTDACHETIAVAQARGIAVPTEFGDAVLSYAENVSSADFRSSMARDVEVEKPLEIEAINGAIVRSGEEVGVPTPANRTVYEELLPVHKAAMARRAQETR
jgi:2-dehydropantoate 2-reductase